MTSEEVTVHIARDDPDSLEAGASSIETRESFGVVLRNHGSPVHVHCGLDGNLTRIASMDQSNYYVEADEEAYVPVIVDGVEGPVSGTLEVSTGYGAQSVMIDVTVNPDPSPVDVDESLGQPASPTTESESGFLDEGDVDPETVGVLVLGAIAVLIALVAALTIDGPAATVGFFVVVGGVAIAIGMVLRG